MALLDHEGGAEFPHSKDEVFDALMKAIPGIKGMKIDKSDKLSGRIFVKAGISLMSWGENIPIYITEISPRGSRVSVTSSPRTGLLLGGTFDLGKNRANIEKILDATCKILSQNGPIEGNAILQTEDPTHRILKLKDLFEKGLISKGEFENKKSEILSKL